MTSSRESLIFDWPGKHNLHVVLPLAIFIAALLHGGIFYVFFIVYPRPENDLKQPAQVYFVPSGKADHARFFAFLETADPALFAPGRGLIRKENWVSSSYTPQYDTQKIIFEPLPTLSRRERKRSIDYGPLPFPILPRIDKKKSAALSTQLFSAGHLARRLPVFPSFFHFEAQVRQTFEPTVFLVGVRADGSVAHIIPQRGSGNVQLDESALKLLYSLKFEPAKDEMEWGSLSFLWGGDIQFQESQ